MLDLKPLKVSDKIFVLASISTVLQRANTEEFMSVACQEKAILRRLPPNHGMGVGSSARPEATR